MQPIDSILRASNTLNTIKLANFSALFLSFFLSSPTFAQSFGTDLEGDAIAVMIQAQLPIDLVDSGYGPYDYRLMEPLSDLGRHLQEAGDHASALAVFKQALHITRVNNGLIHESQIVLLDSMIQSDIALQNWSRANDHYAYMEHLYRRLYKVDDSRLEVGLQKIVSWHVNALNVNLDGRRLEHLQQANKLFKLRLQVAELTLTADDPKLDFLNHNIAVSERQLYLASEIAKEMRRQQRKIKHNPSLLALD